MNQKYVPKLGLQSKTFIYDRIYKQLLYYSSLHFQTYDILTVMTCESARVGGFSPHVIAAVK